VRRDVLHAAAGAVLASALALSAQPAEAHLIAARQGTVNVVGVAVFTVLSVPVSSLPDVDDNHDGKVDVLELDRHEAALRAEIDRRLLVLDGATPARTVRVDLILSPEHGAAGDRADQIVVLKHAELDAPPTDLRVHCDLFGTRASEQALTITATRHPASGTETEVGVLTPETTELAFFPPPPAPPPRTLLGWLEGLLALSAALVVTGALASRSRARGHLSPVPRA
jgi:hypothetical protein